MMKTNSKNTYMKLKDVPTGIKFKLPGLEYWIVKTEKMHFANPERSVEVDI